MTRKKIRNRYIYIHIDLHHYIHHAKIKTVKLAKITFIVVIFIGIAELQRLLEQHTLAEPMMPVST
jgi:hypothetical protein